MAIKVVRIKGNAQALKIKARLQESVMKEIEGSPEKAREIAMRNLCVNPIELSSPSLALIKAG